MTSKIVEKTKDFVFNLLKNELPNTFIYHNYTHTERVYRSLNEILDNTDINDTDKEVLQLSALLHDVGYIKTVDAHEEESVNIAKAFLAKENVSEKTIDLVAQCIMATKFKDTPKNLLEDIIRDADASHFGKSYFNEASEYLRKELEIQHIATYSPEDWVKENIRVLSEQHEYYTEYAKTHWQPLKEKHLRKLRKAKEKEKIKKIETKLKAKYKAQYKNESPERGIQSFYRVTLRNHIKLSDIADTKANILLSVNAIIISLVISNLISKLDSASNAYLIWPTAIFIVFSVISMVLSILATRPNITSGKFTKEDVENKKVNLAFFGNFHQMELDEFEWAIQELIKDRNYLYNALTKDLYFLGVVLDKKYRILRLTYTIFTIGIIVSVIAFGVSFKLQSGM